MVSEAEINRAAEAVDSAQRPIIIAGGGVRFRPTPVVTLAEAIGCPVITTVAGRGVIAGTHELCPGAQLRAEACAGFVAGSRPGHLAGYRAGADRPLE